MLINDIRFPEKILCLKKSKKKFMFPPFPFRCARVSWIHIGESLSHWVSLWVMFLRFGQPTVSTVLILLTRLLSRLLTRLLSLFLSRLLSSHHLAHPLCPFLTFFSVKEYTWDNIVKSCNSISDYLISVMLIVAMQYDSLIKVIQVIHSFVN